MEAELNDTSQNDAKIQEELGDLLFSCVNLVRFLSFDPEQTLRRANAKFERRFRFIEGKVKDSGGTIENTSLEAMESYWEQAKDSHL